MVRKSTGLAGIFDEPEANAGAFPTEDNPSQSADSMANTSQLATTRPGRKSSHPGKKPVLIHIPEDMHRTLRQLSVEDGGEPLTKITERALRQYLVQRGHTKYAQ